MQMCSREGNNLQMFTVPSSGLTQGVSNNYSGPCQVSEWTRLTHNFVF